MAALEGETGARGLGRLGTGPLVEIRVATVLTNAYVATEWLRCGGGTHLEIQGDFTIGATAGLQLYFEETDGDPDGAGVVGPYEITRYDSSTNTVVRHAPTWLGTQKFLLHVPKTMRWVRVYAKGVNAGGSLALSARSISFGAQ